MISYVLFWGYSLFVLFPIIAYSIYCQIVSTWTLVGISIWVFLLAIKLTPTGALITQYISFCKYRSRKPERLLPKMDFEQVEHLMSVKELRADFDYVKNIFGDGNLCRSYYYNSTEKDESSAFVRCSIMDNNGNKIFLNPATYIDYFRMCHLVKKGIASICPENTVDVQLANLNAIRNVLRGIQDKEIAKMQDIALENKEIENRILNDGKVKIKIK